MMGTSNGLDDFDEEAICEYAESYGYIHELDAKGLKEALEGLGYTVLTEKEAKYCIIQ
jgi:predicted transcriptional regulator